LRERRAVHERRTAQMTNAAPLVSIVCLTFNHEDFVGQAIESFLAQKAAFAFEIIIHDDASTDNTATIAREYESRHPELIRLVARTENLYSTGARVPAEAFSHARGTFIAFCEGDDYWCDTNKLQQQADFLLKHPGCGVVFTRSKIRYEAANRTVMGRDRTSVAQKHALDALPLLLLDNPYTSCTSMFRADAVIGYEEVARRLRTTMDDYVMWLHIADRHAVGYLGNVTAVYRVRERSMSHSPDIDEWLRFCRSAFRVSMYFNRRRGEPVERSRIKNAYRSRVLAYCIQRGHYRRSFHFAKSPVEYVMLFLRTLLNSGNVRIRRSEGNALGK
jgi:glycosyltransferase involved in cell wall biosynthesis